MNYKNCFETKSSEIKHVTADIWNCKPIQKPKTILFSD